MIKINLVREGRAVRGAGAAPGPAAAAGGAPSNLNTILIVAGLVIGILAAGGWWFLKNSELNRQKETVASKEAEATRLQAIIKQVEEFQHRKDSLQKRIDLINQLKQNQKGPVRVMDQISRDLPDLVWLDKMTISGNAISLSGRGLNPNAIANFVDNLKNDPLFTEPDLHQVNQVSQTPLVYSFDMSFQFTYTPKGGTGAATDTAATSGTSGTGGSTTAGTTSGTAKPTTTGTGKK